MTVLLNCSMSWCQNNDSTPLWEVEQKDSIVCVPVSVIRVANTKLIELKYEKEINSELNNIIYNDSIIIETLKYNLSVKDKKIATLTKQVKKYKVERDVTVGTTCGATGACLVLLLLLLL